MTSDPRPCSFCGRASTLRPSPTQDLCEACALRVADLAADRSENIWANVASGSGSRSVQPEAVEKIDVDQMFEAFKEGVAKQISKDDADSHLNLATAYSEMGLFVDARREASIAIAAGSTARAKNDALRLLLTPPLLPGGALGRLRERLLRPVN